MDVSRLLSTSKRALMLINFTVMFPSTYFACGAREFILIQRQHPWPAEVKSFRPRLPHPLNFRVADQPDVSHFSLSASNPRDASAIREQLRERLSASRDSDHRKE